MSYQVEESPIAFNLHIDWTVQRAKVFQPDTKNYKQSEKFDFDEILVAPRGKWKRGHIWNFQSASSQCTRNGFSEGHVESMGDLLILGLHKNNRIGLSRTFPIFAVQHNCTPGTHSYFFAWPPWNSSLWPRAPSFYSLISLILKITTLNPIVQFLLIFCFQLTSISSSFILNIFFRF